LTQDEHHRYIQTIVIKTIFFKEGCVMKVSIQKFYCVAFLFVLTTVNTYAVDYPGVVATINVGVTPDGIAITPDNRFAYVANNNNYSLTGADTVSVLDLRNNTNKQYQIAVLMNHSE
jgi:DNA-binding beta-propeller fold protein YncE